MRRFASILLTGLLLMMLLAAPVYANIRTGGDWYCIFLPNEDFDTNMAGATNQNLWKSVSEMQPGDTTIFYMELQNKHPQTTDWYMANQVLDSLEASRNAAAGGGGAYTYDLRYVGPDGEKIVLYSSDNVGGDTVFSPEREGLNEATGALEEFFYLDTLGSGQAAHLTLTVGLEGETQGNAYQDTFADLKLNFAVELSENTPPPNATPTPTPSTPGSTPTPSSPGTTTSTPRTTSTPDTFTPVRTGDEADPLLWAGIMLGCGVVALALCIFMMRRNRKRNREDDRDE